MSLEAEADMLQREIDDRRRVHEELRIYREHRPDLLPMVVRVQEAVARMLEDRGDQRGAEIIREEQERFAREESSVGTDG